MLVVFIINSRKKIKKDSSNYGENKHIIINSQIINLNLYGSSIRHYSNRA